MVPPNVSEVMGALPERQSPARIVNASNQSSGPGMTIVVGLFITAGSMLIGGLTVQVTGLPMWVGIFVAVGLWLAAGLVALVILNGDLPATLEITQSEKTERRRIREAADIAHRHYDLAEVTENHRHAEAMASIDQAAAFQSIETHIRALYELVESGQRERLIADRGSFSVVVSQPALHAVTEYVYGLYSENGEPNEAMVYESGQIRYAVPWRKNGGEWNRETWSQDAIDYITKPRNGLDPLILPVVVKGQNRGWCLNIEKYPTKASVINWASRFK